jgi:5,10-methylene-tetrahydrofolate dehydrogenase/methenyl tetrahydrofolate cyclohydrolase
MPEAYRARILDGKALAAQIRADLTERVAARVAAGGSPPGLATVLVGEHPASQVYVRSKHRACQEAGMASFEVGLPSDASQPDIVAEIARLNADPQVHGILLQLPLPGHLDEVAILQAIDPLKDVDGLHPENAGLLAQKGRLPRFVPATPLGVMRLLEASEAPIEGANAVVLGRSNIVGVPAALMLLRANATVTLAHSRTQDLAGLCRTADILVAAVGQPEIVRGDWVKRDAIVIDVGINRVEDLAAKRGYRLVGDVAFDEVVSHAGAITPVPGGVGPMTIAMLLENTLKAAELQDS